MDAPTSRFPRFTLRDTLVGMLVIALVLGVFRCTVIDTVRFVRGFPKAYAAWDVGEVVIYHMETHAGEWPNGWAELESTYDAYVAAGRIIRGGMTFAELKEHVDIDFSFSPSELSDVLDEVSTLRVIWLRDGSDDYYYYWDDPNQMVIHYLRNGGRQQ